MIFMCTTKFDIEEKHLAFIKQYMTKEEDEEAEEERSAQLLADDSVLNRSDRSDWCL
jgi:hypothetical protein